MLGEALGSALLGLVVALAALRWLPGRFGSAPLVLATGTVAAALGGLVTRAVLGPGHLPAALALAVAVAVALVSLLVDGRGTRPRSPVPQTGR
ncbi:hypothetical protein V1J52_05780 [Streptomyces sp. TRM 70351]|uniref:hypothetical protein n=1 Tax=Streptomyces sp. TRM 70351 TaxID=3116552 RepID=UPI002E7BE5BC|nr:hypothetical protein [Streptomyces sp. TRM 70351]MEE1927704.1 hypothetical protein [Streptomyces sp. TRM 70351]